MAEDTWAEIHHILGYKPDKRTSLAVRKQFQIISSLLAVIDEHFNFLAEELGRFQREVTYEPTHPLNAENLPAVLAEFNLVCAQREVDGLLKVLNSRGLPLVGDFRRVATDVRIDLIRSVYLSETASDATTFDVVAQLANLAGQSGNPEDERRVLLAQIEMLKDHEQRKHR